MSPKKIGSVFIVLVTVIAAFTSFALPYFSTKYADATLAGFDAGNIMSDITMSSKDTMTVSQIQAFLNSKNDCNNNDYATYLRYNSAAYTYHWVGPANSNGHFVCMAQETFDQVTGLPAATGLSAAQIIYNAAQKYSINPQVLLVLLQKEQGLITDTFPHSRQYQTATGYGCPDTAPCDTQYYGLVNQLNNAANFYQRILSGSWTGNYPVGTRYVLYHPNTACGGTNVTIKNRATGALYTYTPYQPNTAALAANYGTGNSCSAYGNRNFYNYFTDWFGSTQSNRWSPMTDPRVMIVIQDTLPINPDTMELGSSWLQVGDQLVFESKTTLSDGRVCLRTRSDSASGESRCILLLRLGEFTPTFTTLTDDTQLFASTQWTCKVNIHSISVLCPESVDENQVVKIAASAENMGITYYITKHDWDLGIRDKGMLAVRFRKAYAFQSIEPIPMKAVSTTDKYIPGTDITKQPIANNQIIYFSSKTIIDNKTYYRTTVDTTNNNNLVIPENSLTPNFSPFISPRNLRTNKTTVSRNILTGQTCSTVLSGAISFFDSKITVGSTIYYRTRTETAKGSLCVIDATVLSEI
jgi:hypothetical protein